MLNEYYHNDPEYDDGMNVVFDEEDIFGMNYDSDTFFNDSDSEYTKNLVARCKKGKADQNTRDYLNDKSVEKFEYWQFLPSELKEMIVEKMDFATWINFMICSGGGEDNFELPDFSFVIDRVSFYSDVIQEGLKEMEYIRIRVHDGLRALLVKIRECDGYCKFSWNCDNRDAGSINILNCSYLKVAEKIMKMCLTPYCPSFKIVVNKNKTDHSAQFVSKWPYFHTFLRKCLGMENDVKKFVDEQLMVDFILEKANNLVIENPKSKKAVPMWWRRIECDLTLPNLDAKKVVDLIGEQLPEILASREKMKPVKTDEEKWVYERYIVTEMNENTINIEGPMSDYNYDRFCNDKKNDENVE